MSKVLALAFILVLFLEAAGAAICRKCKLVGINNHCTVEEKTCNSHFWSFCYTRIIKKGESVVRIDRGCTSQCHSVKKARKKFEEKMLCCVKDYCNDHNFWTSH